jgi:hypothetical protein
MYMGEKMPNFFSAFMNKKRSLKPQYAVVGEELLSLIADLKKRVGILEESRLVKTHWEGDHERIDSLISHISGISSAFSKQCTALKYLENRVTDNAHVQAYLGKRITAAENKIEALESAHISDLTRRIYDAAKPKRDKRGRFLRGNGHATS